MGTFLDGCRAEMVGGGQACWRRSGGGQRLPVVRTDQKKQSG